MSFTVQEAINDQRSTIGFLNDPSGVRWTNAILIANINAALGEIWKRRRSAFYVSSIVTSQPSSVTAVGDAVPVIDSYRLALAHFVSFLSFIADADDTANSNAAQHHYDLFEKEMG